MIKFSKLSQISIIEFAFVALLLFLAIGYIYNNNNIQSQNYSFSVESLIDSIYYSQEYRDLILDENLGVGPLSQDWGDLSLFLNNTVGNYEFIISSNNVEKKIFSCNETLNKYFAQRIIAIKDNENYEFREFRLGVCQ